MPVSPFLLRPLPPPLLFFASLSREKRPWDLLHYIDPWPFSFESPDGEGGAGEERETSSAEPLAALPAGRKREARVESATIDSRTLDLDRDFPSAPDSVLRSRRTFTPVTCDCAF